MQIALAFKDTSEAVGPQAFSSDLESWTEFGKETVVERLGDIPVYINEFWTSKQRAAHSIHEISYRACFKPQVARFFIDRLTGPGSVVYDPFMGRGTTVIEAALGGRTPYGSDVNPLSKMLAEPRLAPPSMDAIQHRLSEIDLSSSRSEPKDLLVFYHKDTLREICSLRDYLLDREREGSLDTVDKWIRMVAINRLTGHSPGFFSVYSLPPNQAVSVASQRKINKDRAQVPAYRSVVDLILKKSKSLLRHSVPDGYAERSEKSLLLSGESHAIPKMKTGSVDLVVTSPPFLDVVNYKADNWLRCWFAGIDADGVNIAHHKNITEWENFIKSTFQELERVIKVGGHVAFEVGEVRGGKVLLEEHVVAAVSDLSFAVKMIVINDQKFTKTANCWGVKNNSKGTNTNRIIVLERI